MQTAYAIPVRVKYWKVSRALPKQTQELPSGEVNPKMQLTMKWLL